MRRCQACASEPPMHRLETNSRYQPNAAKRFTVSSSILPARQPGRPTVSIVIPTYNRSAIVPIAIESALRQTFEDYELIVVDDGSTDGTRERLDPYMGRIRYFYQSNRGVSAARNAGIAAARGEWIAILDSDDVWHPAKLERQLEVLSKLGTGFGACVTDCDYIGSLETSATVFEENGVRTDGASGPLDNPLNYVMRSGYGLCVPSLLVRRSILNEIGGFDEALGLGEDRELIFRLCFRTRFCYVQQPLVSIDRTPGVARLTDLCSMRDDSICLWGEQLRKKMLAHPEFVDADNRRLVEDELISLYYDWATARMRDFNLKSFLLNISKIRQLGQSYPIDIPDPVDSHAK